jgi:CRISPR/Cas system endoribonuclease Cas6 (RAMP superfamily)
LFIETHHLDALEMTRYEFRLRSLSEVLLPPFLGSTLRGAFGHALKAVTCSTPHGDCSRCLLVERCVYPRVFETAANHAEGLLAKSKDAPRPFIFIPPVPNPELGFGRARDDWLRWRMPVTAGEQIVFGLSLFGETIRELPYIVYTISLMAQQGFGVGRAPFALESVAAIDAEGKREHIYTPELVRLRPCVREKTTLGDYVRARLTQIVSSNELTLRFITPTRIRVKGEVTENPTFAKLVSSLSLRLSLLGETHGDAPLGYDYKDIIERTGGVETRFSDLRLVALERFSNRRRGKLGLDGFTGDVRFTGPPLHELMPLIVAGEFVNVGSSTAFGLGRYCVVTS